MIRHLFSLGDAELHQEIDKYDHSAIYENNKEIIFIIQICVL